MPVTRPAGRPQRGRARPLPRGTSLYTPEASGARRTLERRSSQALVTLHQLPVWVLPILVAGFLGWLAALSWPRLAPGPRLLRVAAIACVLAAAGIQAVR